MLAKADLDLEVLVAWDDLLLAQDGVGEGGMEGLRKYILAGTGQVDGNGFTGGDGPCSNGQSC
jgi:hypothetical protein